MMRRMKTVLILVILMAGAAFPFAPVAVGQDQPVEDQPVKEQPVIITSKPEWMARIKGINSRFSSNSKVQWETGSL